MEVTAKSQEKKVISEIKEEKSYTKIIIGIIIILIIIFALIFALYISKNRVLVLSRAYGSGNQVELANSYLFASPLKAKAGSSERIRVTVFVLDSQGKGVFGRNVILGESDSIRVLPVQPTTDLIGRAVFDVAGSVSGYYVLEATVDGKVIPQRVGLTFN
jgi:hypothetical protein